MENDELMRKLTEGWKNVEESLVCPSPIEGAVIVEEDPDRNHYELNEKEYWGSVGAGIIPYAKDTKKFLLSLRSDMVNEPGTWGVIGGKLDEHETDPKQAAIREFKEEIGLHIRGDINLIYVYKSPEVDENGESLFKYYTFVAKIDKELKELETKEYGWETERCKWFSLEEIKRIRNLHFGIKSLVKHNALQDVMEGKK